MSIAGYKDDFKSLIICIAYLGISNKLTSESYTVMISFSLTANISSTFVIELFVID